ncbi:hypothetical protein [Spirillospora sp. NPDC047279]|uniref:hypothetical protein n=1 Tax=Spirillospora sp. NPDC047279 TaxID=3155478 RepID=UPI0033D7B221
MVRWNDVREGWLAAEGVVRDSAPPPATSVKQMRRLSLFRTTAPLTVTGYRGAGKSTLYDALEGRVSLGYRPPGKSLGAETHRTVFKTGRKKIRAESWVLPGQPGEERNEALGRVMGDGNYPVGVVHAVSWGYNSVRADELPHLEDRLIADGRPRTIASVRDLNLKEELQDFKDISRRLVRAWSRRDKVWLIIVVTKSDLFWDDRRKAMEYYLPGEGAGSAFSRHLDDFADTLGDALERVLILPFSCFPEPYKIFHDEAPSQFVNREQDALFNNFLSVMGKVL